MGVKEIDRYLVSWVVIIVDICSILVLLVAICLIPSSTVKKTNFFNKNKMLVSDFSIHFKELDFKGARIYEEINDLLLFISDVIKTEIKDFDETDLALYEVNFPIMTDYQLDLLQQKNQNEIKKCIIYEEAEANGKSRENLSEEQKSIITELDSKLTEINSELRKSLVEDLDDTDDVFITFKYHKHKKLIKKAFTENLCAKKICCKDKYQHL